MVKKISIVFVSILLMVQYLSAAVPSDVEIELLLKAKQNIERLHKQWNVSPEAITKLQVLRDQTSQDTSTYFLVTRLVQFTQSLVGDTNTTLEAETMSWSLSDSWSVGETGTIVFLSDPDSDSLMRAPKKEVQEEEESNVIVTGTGVFLVDPDSDSLMKKSVKEESAVTKNAVTSTGPIQLWFPDLYVQRVFHDTSERLTDNGQYPLTTLICNKGEPVKNQKIAVTYARAGEVERRIKTVFDVISLRTGVCTTANDNIFRISPRDITFDPEQSMFEDAGYKSSSVSYKVIVKVDSLNKVFETDEKNNVRSGTVKVYPILE